MGWLSRHPNCVSDNRARDKARATPAAALGALEKNKENT